RSSRIESLRLQRRAKPSSPAEKQGAIVVHSFRQSQSRSDLCREIRRQRRRKNKCARVIHKVFFQNCRTANKCSGRGQRFSTSVNDGERFRGNPSGRRQSVARRPMNARRMRFIENQCSTVFFRKGEKFNQGCDVSIHA